MARRPSIKTLGNELLIFAIRRIARENRAWLRKARAAVRK